MAAQAPPAGPPPQIPPLIPGPANAAYLTQDPAAGQLALVVSRPANVTPAQWNTLLDRLRREAGPQLLPQLPPWWRPGPVAGPGAAHRQQWPTRTPNYAIAIPANPATTPDVNTHQVGVNQYLAGLHVAFQGAVVGPVAPGGQPLHARQLAASRKGPRIFDREVSSQNPADRLAAFPSHIRPHTTNTRDFGAQPDANPALRIALADYSATCREFSRTGVRLTEGTVVAVASPEPSANFTANIPAGQQQRPAAQHRFLRQLAAAPGLNVPNPPAGGLIPLPAARPVDYWHASAVFIRSFRYAPRLRPGDAASWTRYAFDGVRQIVLIYDSCYPNENVPANGGAGLVTQSLGQNNWSRIGQHVMLSTVNRLLYGADGLAARYAWIRQPRSVWIGGGGNVGGIDECRRMTAVWMAQIATLERAWSGAAFDLYRNPSPQTETAFRVADDEFDRFIEDYTEVRP